MPLDFTHWIFKENIFWTEHKILFFKKINETKKENKTGESICTWVRIVTQVLFDYLHPSTGDVVIKPPYSAYGGFLGWWMVETSDIHAANLGLYPVLHGDKNTY